MTTASSPSASTAFWLNSTKTMKWCQSRKPQTRKGFSYSKTLSKPRKTRASWSIRYSWSRPISTSWKGMRSNRGTIWTRSLTMSGRRYLKENRFSRKRSLTRSIVNRGSWKERYKICSFRSKESMTYRLKKSRWSLRMTFKSWSIPRGGTSSSNRQFRCPKIKNWR